MGDEKASETGEINGKVAAAAAGRKKRKPPASGGQITAIPGRQVEIAKDRFEGQRGLQDEILSLRAMMRQVLAQADEGRSLAELLRMLEVLGKTSTRLAALIKAERSLAADQDLATALSQALSQATRELGLSK